MKPTNLIELYASRQPAETLLASMLSKNAAESTQAGLDLVASARSLGVDARDYLRLAVDPAKGQFAGGDLDGYEAALAYLNLPLRDDFAKGVILQAGAETFQTFPGVRALFPVVMDNIVQWKYRQDQYESTAEIVGQTRTIAGTELITTVVNDTVDDYSQFGMVAEGQRIPIRAIRATEKSVRIFKFGGGYRHTYEFARRAALDIMVPYALRLQREIEIAKVRSATTMMLNGDSVQGVPTNYNASDLGTAVGRASVPGKLVWDIFLKFLTIRAAAMLPVDTIMGNYNTYFQYLQMFTTPAYGAGPSQVDLLKSAGVDATIANPRFNINVKFVLSSSMPDNVLLGFSKADTMEELIETGSDIAESERSIQNQVMTYVQTTNAGYRLVFGDTRATLTLN